jgi:ferredoxin
VLIVSILAWLGWNHVNASWKQHKANVEFAAQNECLDPSTGNVHPVSPSGKPWCGLFETIHKRGASIDQWALVTALPTVPPGEYVVRDGDIGQGSGKGTPAQICVNSPGTRHCFLFDGYSYGAHAQEVKLSNGGRLILFTADEPISADSAILSTALLANRGGELKNILSLKHYIEVYDVWNLPDGYAYISTMPVLLTAYSIWDMGMECHACAHCYTIVSYVYDTQDGEYKQFDEFKTSAKYESYEQKHGNTNVDKIFDVEKANILAGLRKASDAEANRHLILKP